MEEIEQVAIDIDDTDETTQERFSDLDVFIRKMLAELDAPRGQQANTFLPCIGEKTIFRFPEHDRELCDPRVVSIGPYHHGRLNLQAMETYKWRALGSFLAYGEDVGLESYLEALRSIESQTRRCYSEPVDMASDDFVKMMLLDGCFILEWLSSRQNWDYSNLQYLDIFYDLCLIENQVPFIVIEALWTIRFQGNQDSSQPGHLINLINTVFEDCSSDIQCIRFNPIEDKNCDSIWHLLHIYYMGVAYQFEKYHPQTKKRSKTSTWFKSHVKVYEKAAYFFPKLRMSADNSSQNVGSTDVKDIRITCASELCDLGIKFKKKKVAMHMLDITCNRGTIEMPFVQIESRFVRMLWNMVALEQVCTGWDSLRPLSSYLALMDALIDTKKDIPILERAGIVDNYFSNAYEAAYFFNQFSKAFRLNYRFHYFYGLFRTVRESSESTLSRQRARLMQDYFSNPWASISVLAAAALFALTILQTYYAAKAA